MVYLYHEALLTRTRQFEVYFANTMKTNLLYPPEKNASDINDKFFFFIISLYVLTLFYVYFV